MYCSNHKADQHLQCAEDWSRWGFLHAHSASPLPSPACLVHPEPGTPFERCLDSIPLCAHSSRLCHLFLQTLGILLSSSPHLASLPTELTSALQETLVLYYNKGIVIYICGLRLLPYISTMVHSFELDLWQALFSSQVSKLKALLIDCWGEVSAATVSRSQQMIF